MSDATGPSGKAPRWALWLPLALFAGLAALFVAGLLWPADRNVVSTMVGKPLPQFALKPAVAEVDGVSTGDFRGKPRLLNIFASWCIPCAVEAPQLAELAARGAEIHGVAIRDRPEDVSAFLARYGNPFARIGADDVSSVQMALGSSGVPETFVIDGRGVIRYQHIGDIRAEQVPMILEKLKEAEQ
jgi:cytochrome c biogenesis protein CcmG, thiol:disulfide interchange protein DsbE